MGETTLIPWSDKTWNPFQGCTKVSAGCEHCYMHRQKRQYGQDPSVVKRSSDATFTAPLRWKKPALVFTCSWSDFFHPDTDEWREEAWDVIRRTPHLTYQILTKRPERIVGRLPLDWGQGWNNVWLGVTVENADCMWRLEYLLGALGVPVALHFVSCGPLLGPLDLTPWLRKHRKLGWVIVEGESGGPPERRLVEKNPRVEIPMVEVDGEMYGVEMEMCDPNSGGDGWRPKPTALEWVRSIRDQCQVAEVPFFLKGFGGPKPTSGGHLLDGREWREFPGKKGAYGLSLAQQRGPGPAVRAAVQDSGEGGHEYGTAGVWRHPGEDYDQRERCQEGEGGRLRC